MSDATPQSGVGTEELHRRTTLIASNALIMQSFRAYLLNPAGKIVRGEWIEASNDEHAMEKALELCDAGHPSVELWQGQRRLGELSCS